jgi:hypothetical protein
VKLINTDGLAFIGPGSEWFWTAVSGLVLAITFLAIYRQLRFQRDAAATEQVNGLLNEWSSERMARAKLTVLLALEAGTDPLDLPDRAVSHVGFFWQRVGYLARRGHMDRRLVYEHLGSQIEDWWAWLRPRVLADREGTHDPGLWQGFEWLAGDAAARDAQRGVRRRDDAERLEWTSNPGLTLWRFGFHLRPAEAHTMPPWRARLKRRTQDAAPRSVHQFTPQPFRRQLRSVGLTARRPRPAATCLSAAVNRAAGRPPAAG